MRWSPRVPKAEATGGSDLRAGDSLPAPYSPKGRSYGQAVWFSVKRWPSSYGPIGEERAPQEISTR
jgi:hypothetical protein